MTDFRTEHDSMGEVQVPRDALWRAQTQRAVENFPISGTTLEPRHVQALGLVKQAAARVNGELEVLAEELVTAIESAAAQIAAGDHVEHFPLDVFQTGSGTSSNMNTNEVIASLASAGGVEVHPNDHVNASQSSNDTFPTSIHVAATLAVVDDLLPRARRAGDLAGAQGRGVRRRGEVRPHAPDGRHPGDAGPGVRRVRRDRAARRSSAWSRCSRGSASSRWAAPPSAPGSTPRPASRPRVIEELGELTGQPFTEARNHFEAQGTRDSLVELSGVLRTFAVGLTKICNDLRWMSSGPTTGLAEIHLPDLQPGSSIMPGKVNPVLPEATLMVCAQVVGNDATVAWAGAAGNFELNVMMPVMARNLLESIRLLATSSRLLAERCVDGITADTERMRRYAESSPSVVTPLNKYVGYEAAAKIAKKALADGATIRETVLALGYVERGELTEEQLDAALDVESMTHP